MPAHRRLWTPVFNGQTALVPLTRGEWAEVDLADLHLVADRAWRSNGRPGHFYAVAWKPDRSGVDLMHRVIFACCPEDVGPDHVNRNGLDNRRCNLRTATPSQNMANRRPRHDSRSKFKGVSSRKDNKSWAATVGIDGTRIHVGTFHDEEEAARAYDAVAKEVHGEYAYLNFPDES